MTNYHNFSFFISHFTIYLSFYLRKDNVCDNFKTNILPLLGRKSIHNSLLSSERLRGDDKEHSLRIDSPQDLSNMSTIDVRDEMNLDWSIITVRLQSLGDHIRSEIAAADTDVNHISDAFAGVAEPLTRANRVNKRAHLVEHRVHLSHDVHAAQNNRAIGSVAKSDVQHCSVLREVDLVAAEHSIAFVLDATISSL